MANSFWYLTLIQTALFVAAKSGIWPENIRLFSPNIRITRNHQESFNLRAEDPYFKILGDIPKHNAIDPQNGRKLRFKTENNSEFPSLGNRKYLTKFHMENCGN